MQFLRSSTLFKIVIYLIGIQHGFSQLSNFNYLIEMNTSFSTNETLPFWIYSNKFGNVPKTDHLLVTTSLSSSSKKTSSNVAFSYKASFTGYATNSKKSILVNELYGSLHFKNFNVDLGVKHADILWKGLSSSNGNIAFSTNARSFPGYNFSTLNYIKLPFFRKWLSFKATYGDYLLNDNRFVDNTLLHSKSLHFKSKINSKLDFTLGLNHYVQWGGNSPNYGKQPSGFNDYLKVITGSSGGKNANGGDQINALGNAIGVYLLQLNSKGTKTNWSIYYSHPFEDRSGREFMNYPDALYGFFIDLKKPRGFISHILTEVTYTKHNSGPTPHYYDEDGGYHAASGRDDYFNNFVYNSGWTYFGNTIGSPYFTTVPVNEDGITNGIILGDNRFVAINIGWKGMLRNMKYKTIFSNTTYTGWFDNEYIKKPIRFSGITELIIPKKEKFPVEITLGIAFDTGTYRPVTFGGFFKLTKNGTF